MAAAPDPLPPVRPSAGGLWLYGLAGVVLVLVLLFAAVL